MLKVDMETMRPVSIEEEKKVRQLHEMINASLFGWPSVEEVKKAHELLDEIVRRE